MRAVVSILRKDLLVLWPLALFTAVLPLMSSAMLTDLPLARVSGTLKGRLVAAVSISPLDLKASLPTGPVPDCLPSAEANTLHSLAALFTKYIDIEYWLPASSYTGSEVVFW